MPEQHQATPDEWAQQADNGLGWRSPASSCIVELRARIEALEAAQPAHVNYAPVKPEHQDKLDRLIEQDRSDAQQLALVERVAERIVPLEREPGNDSAPDCPIWARWDERRRIRELLAAEANTAWLHADDTSTPPPREP